MTHIVFEHEAEAEVREFAAQFPTPNVLRAVAAAEAGRITWLSLYDLARSALTRAAREVQNG